MPHDAKLCDACPYRGIPLSLPFRLWLLVLSSAACVLVPAVMIDTAHVLHVRIGEDDPGDVFIIALSLLPLAVVMVFAFIGLYNAMFGGRWANEHVDTRRCNPLDEKS